MPREGLKKGDGEQPVHRAMAEQVGEAEKEPIRQKIFPAAPKSYYQLLLGTERLNKNACTENG